MSASPAAGTGTAPDASALNNAIGGFVERNIGRIVTGVVGPLVLTLTPPVTKGLNKLFGTGLSDQEVSNVAIAAIAGLALMGYRWLANRGEWERAVAGVQHVYAAGQPLVPGAPALPAASAAQPAEGQPAPGQPPPQAG